MQHKIMIRSNKNAILLLSLIFPIIGIYLLINSAIPRLMLYIFSSITVTSPLYRF